ncbi:MAG: pantetheine-phosphate adenylyltransferase [Planctomycetota bacterium]
MPHSLKSSMPRVAIYAGSFDPVTNGHMFMIREGAQLFDKLIIAIGTNPDKKYTFPLEKRLAFVRASVKDIPNIEVTDFTNQFLVRFASDVGASFILRGIRNFQDYEFERAMRQINNDLNDSILSVFLMPPRDASEVSSSFVKGLVGPDGWETVVRQFIPEKIYDDFIAFYRNKKLPTGSALTGAHLDE